MIGDRKLGSVGYNPVLNCLMMGSVVLTQYMRVTDRRTDRQTDTARQHIPRYEYTSHGKCVPLVSFTCISLYILGILG